MSWRTRIQELTTEQVADHLLAEAASVKPELAAWASDRYHNTPKGNRWGVTLLTADVHSAAWTELHRQTDGKED